MVYLTLLAYGCYKKQLGSKTKLDNNKSGSEQANHTITKEIKTSVLRPKLNIPKYLPIGKIQSELKLHYDNLQLPVYQPIQTTHVQDCRLGHIVTNNLIQVKCQEDDFSQETNKIIVDAPAACNNSNYVNREAALDSNSAGKVETTTAENNETSKSFNQELSNAASVLNTAEKDEPKNKIISNSSSKPIIELPKTSAENAPWSSSRTSHMKEIDLAKSFLEAIPEINSSNKECMPKVNTGSSSSQVDASDKVTTTTITTVDSSQKAPSFVEGFKQDETTNSDFDGNVNQMLSCDKTVGNMTAQGVKRQKIGGLRISISAQKRNQPPPLQTVKPETRDDLTADGVVSNVQIEPNRCLELHEQTIGYTIKGTRTEDKINTGECSTPDAKSRDVELEESRPPSGLSGVGYMLMGDTTFSVRLQENEAQKPTIKQQSASSSYDDRRMKDELAYSEGGGGGSSERERKSWVSESSVAMAKDTEYSSWQRRQYTDLCGSDVSYGRHQNEKKRQHNYSGSAAWHHDDYDYDAVGTKYRDSGETGSSCALYQPPPSSYHRGDEYGSVHSNQSFNNHQRNSQYDNRPQPGRMRGRGKRRAYHQPW